MLSDQKRQEDEIFVIENVCNKHQFRYKKNVNIECSLSISCNLINENITIDYQNAFRKLVINHLPPVRLYIQLPNNYPSQSPPKYNIAVNWLTPWEISLICQRLDELWQENDFNEILFIWLSFLKNDLLSFLHIKDILQVSYLMELFKNPNEDFLLDLLKWMDARVIYGGLFLNPVEKLIDYNESRNLLNFESQCHECAICFCINSGKMCIRIDECNHIFCKDCILQYLTVRINERNVNSILCPSADCKVKITYNQIRNVCSTNVFKKYENYVFENQILRTKQMRIVYCPRRICKTAVYLKFGECLASCLACEYNFCAFCFKVYHGVAACAMDSDEKLKLIKEYESADHVRKKLLEKKYGRQQIQQIVEKHLTSDYLQKNTKSCPNCDTLIAKLTGCNLITCTHCYSKFCWLCNSKIESNDENLYEHFTSRVNGLCNGRLFEATDSEIDNFDPEVDNGYEIVPNWNLNMFLNMLHVRK